jgi:hypothetical protein
MYEVARQLTVILITVWWLQELGKVWQKENKEIDQNLRGKN